MSLPPGFRVRNATAADAYQAAEVVRRFELGWLSVAETRDDDIGAEWRELDPGRDVWLVEERSGETVAYAAVYMEGSEVALADGYVVPEASGRGLGRYLVSATEQRSEELGARTVQNAVLEQDAAALRLLEAAGYSAVRRFAQMVIELTSSPPVADPPPGVTLRPFQPGADDEAFHAALTESFANHWGFVSEPFQRWRELNLASPRFDAGLWFIAEQDGVVVGVVRGTWKQNDMGWVNDLGVLPAWRRRGVALALLTRAFAEFHSRGEQRIGLGVDTRNETGATQLYERAGMRPAYSTVFYERALV